MLRSWSADSSIPVLESPGISGFGNGAHDANLVGQWACRVVLVQQDVLEVPVKLFYMEPRYLEMISAELASCQKRCRVLNGNERFAFSH
jgi:hypothetical protein